MVVVVVAVVAALFCAVIDAEHSIDCCCCGSVGSHTPEISDVSTGDALCRFLP